MWAPNLCWMTTLSFCWMLEIWHWRSSGDTWSHSCEGSPRRSLQQDGSRAQSRPGWTMSEKEEELLEKQLGQSQWMHSVLETQCIFFNHFFFQTFLVSSKCVFPDWGLQHMADPVSNRFYKPFIRRISLLWFNSCLTPGLMSRLCKNHKISYDIMSYHKISRIYSISMHIWHRYQRYHEQPFGPVPSQTPQVCGRPCSFLHRDLHRWFTPLGLDAVP